MFELIFHVTAGTLPFHLFAYIPFWNYLRLSKKCTMLILFAEQRILTAAFSLLFRLGFSVSASEFVAVFIYGPIFFYLVRLDIRKVAFLYIFTTDYLMIVKGAAFFLVHALLHLPAIGWQSVTMVLVLFFITMPFMLYYLNQTADIVFGLHTSDIWNTIWMLPLFNSITVLVFTYPVANINVLSLTTRILLMVCMFLVYHFLVRSIRQMQMQTIAEERSRSMELVMQMQASQYALLQSCIQDTRRARHDLRHHWKALQGYIDSGDLDALASYIRQYGEGLPTEPTDLYCKNAAVNAILSFYAEKAALLNIDMEIAFSIQDMTLIPESEFCALLGNLLENALEGCNAFQNQQNENASSCFICVRAGLRGEHMLILTVDNTAPRPMAEDGALLSSKHPGLGIGTESVRFIARQYRGDACFEWRDNVFYASVMLNPGS